MRRVLIGIALVGIVFLLIREPGTVGGIVREVLGAVGEFFRGVFGQ